MAAGAASRHVLRRVRRRPPRTPLLGSRPVADKSGRGYTRAALAKRLGVSLSTLYRWQSTSEDHQFPSPNDDGTWELQPVLEWHARHLAAKKAAFTPVDRSGDPEELVDAAAAARILGYRSASTIRAYRAPRHGDYFPEPDEHGASGPRWRRATIWSFADRRERPGGGRPGRSGRKARPDPNLPAVRSMLVDNPELTGRMVAEALDINERKAYRLLKAVKQESTFPENA